MDKLLEIKSRRCIVAAIFFAMKNKILILLCVLFTGMTAPAPASAGPDNSLHVVGDLVIVRPGCLAVTVVGSAIFVVALPIAAISGSVHDTADTLVMHPARATFTRPLGDFSTLN